MFLYNDLSQYSAENILHTSANPSHSGPELAPKSIYADTLAREIVLDKISLVTNERPAWVGAGEPARSLQIKF